MIVHHDRSALASPRQFGAEFVVEGIAARTHTPDDPLHYETGPEYRRLDEVRRIVEQLPRVPVTMPHGGRIVGRVDRAWLDGERAAVRMLITDREAADAIRGGTKELSIGYGTDVVGGWQTNIALVELSVVERARCGAVCAINTDKATASAPLAHVKGIVMNPELVAAAARLNIRTDGLDERGLALAIMRAAGTDPEAARNDDDPTPISQMNDGYVIARAQYAARDYERAAQRRADAATFATAPVQRIDCGCSGKTHADTDPEAAARARMQRSARTEWAQGGAHADEAEAIERIREQGARPMQRATPSQVPTTDEATARRAMLAESRAAWQTPSDDSEVS